MDAPPVLIGLDSRSLGGRIYQCFPCFIQSRMVKSLDHQRQIYQSFHTKNIAELDLCRILFRGRGSEGENTGLPGTDLRQTNKDGTPQKFVEQFQFQF